MPDVITPDQEAARFHAAMSKFNPGYQPPSLTPPADPAVSKDPPAADPAAPAVTKPPAVADAPKAESGGWSETQETIAQFEAAMRKAGHTDAQIAEAKKQAGYKAEVAPVPEEKRNAGEMAYDRQFPTELSRPIQYGGRLPEGTPTEVVAALDAEVKAFIRDANLPGQIAPSLVENLLDAAGKLRAMKPGDVALYKAEQTALARRVLGGEDNLQAAIKAAATALAPATGSRFYELVVRSGAIHSAEFLLAFQHQAQRNAARARAKA
jgi:hypothetical protein